MAIRFKENIIALYTMLYKEVVRIIRIWPQTLLPPAIIMILYFIIFGNLIGARIGNMQDIAYIDYIIPGLIMMTIITNAYANVVSSFFGSKYQRNIEEILISPMLNIVLLWGFVSGGIARGLLVGGLVLIISLFFSNLNIYNISLTILVAVLIAVLFSLAGILNGIFAKNFDDISIIPTFILTPLTYLGGIFYSIDLLPKFWQKVTLVNPIFYMVNGFRYAMLGQSDININTALIVIMGFIIIFHIACLWLIKNGVGIKT